MNCIVCNSSDQITLFTGRDLMHDVAGEFALVQCKQCGLAWVSPQLSAEQIDRHYPPEYLAFLPAIEDEKSRFRQFQRQIGVNKLVHRLIAHSEKQGKVLDIGCATGIFLNAMQQHGWDCYGIEPSTYAAEYAKERFGLNIFTGRLEESQYPEEFFDVITMWDVLEHIPNQKETLKKAWQLLKPNGLLTINMPNAGSWEQYIFGKYWAGWDIPRHFYIYDKNTIRRLLSENGFVVEDIASVTGQHGMFVISMQFWMKDHHLPSWLEKSVSFAINTVLARLITKPINIVADWLDKSSTMVVFARKKK